MCVTLLFSFFFSEEVVPSSSFSTTLFDDFDARLKAVSNFLLLAGPRIVSITIRG